MQLISTVDANWFGVEAFVKSQSKEYRNTAISLAADELTFNEASRICKEKAGLEMPATFSIVDWAVLKVLSDVRVMFEWIAMKSTPSTSIDINNSINSIVIQSIVHPTQTT
jgi:hypothetical protein